MKLPKQTSECILIQATESPSNGIIISQARRSFQFMPSPIGVRREGAHIPTQRADSFAVSPNILEQAFCCREGEGSSGQGCSLIDGGTAQNQCMNANRFLLNCKGDYNCQGNDCNCL